MNKINLEFYDFIYDSCGACPECGSELIPITYYRAGSVTSGYDAVKIGNEYQSVKFKKYSNVEPLVAGLCPTCREKDWQKRQEEKAKAKRPPLGFVFTGFALMAIGIGIFLYLFMNNDPYVEMWIVYVALGITLLGVFWSIGALWDYVKMHNLLLKYRMGWREPLPELSTSHFSSIISSQMNLEKKNESTVFLSEDEVKQMTISLN